MIFSSLSPLQGKREEFIEKEMALRYLDGFLGNNDEDEDDDDDNDDDDAFIKRMLFSKNASKGRYKRSVSHSSKQTTN